MNIAGVIIHSKPQTRFDVRDRLRELPGVEVHAVSDEGKMVITVEEQPRTLLADTIMNLNHVEGVLSAAMVYHHYENDANLQEASA